MPWSSMKDVPSSIKALSSTAGGTDKAPLTLKQVNEIGRMYDGLKDKRGIENAMAIAITNFRKMYRIEGKRWVRIRRVNMGVEDQKTTQLFNFPFFKIGTFNGHTYTENDLERIKTNFYELRNVVKPPLKLGHGAQKFLKEEGMPAAGWINSVRRFGNQLVADIVDIPLRIYDLLKAGRYKRPSAEIYKDFRDETGNSRGPVLAAIALLGADIPAIKTLPGLEDLYTATEELINKYNDNFDRNAILSFEFEFEKGNEFGQDSKKGDDDSKEGNKSLEDDKEEAKIVGVLSNIEHGDALGKISNEGGLDKLNAEETLKKQIDDLNKALEDSKVKFGELEGELDEVKERADLADEFEAKLNRYDEVNRITGLTNFLSELKDEGKVLPVQEGSILAFMASLQDDEDDETSLVKFSEDGKDPESITQLALFRKILEANPNLVEFEEFSKARDDGDGNKSKNEEQRFTKLLHSEKDAKTYPIDSLELATLAEKIEKDEKISYDEALIKASQELGE